MPSITPLIPTQTKLSKIPRVFSRLSKPTLNDNQTLNCVSVNIHTHPHTHTHTQPMHSDHRLHCARPPPVLYILQRFALFCEQIERQLYRQSNCGAKIESSPSAIYCKLNSQALCTGPIERPTAFVSSIRRWWEGNRSFGTLYR